MSATQLGLDIGPDVPVALVATPVGAELHLGPVCLLLKPETISALTAEMVRYSPSLNVGELATQVDNALHNALDHVNAGRPRQALYWIAAAASDAVALDQHMPGDLANDEEDSDV